MAHGLDSLAPRQGARFDTRAREWLLLLLVSAALPALCVDAVLVALREGPFTGLLAGLSSGALAVAVALLASLPCLALARVGASLQRRGFSFAVGLLPTLVCAVALGIAISRPADRLAPELYAAVGAMAGVGVALAAWLGRAEPRRNGRVATALMLVASAGIDLGLGPDVYPEIHDLAWLVQCACLASLLHDVPSLAAACRSRRGLWVSLALLPCAALLGWGIDAWLPNVRAPAVLHGRNHARLARWLGGVVDRDQDGYSPLFWGGDCNDRDAAIHPGALDLPGAGDTNCNGVDPPGEPSLLAAPAVLPGDPALPAESIDRVVLITVDAFRPELLRDDLMPNLMRMLRRGARFERAYAAATRTDATLPLFHRATHRSPSIVPLLERAGVQSAAIAFAIATDDFGVRQSPRRTNPSPHGYGEEEQTRAALEVLQKATRKTYLWTHYYGTHDPYTRWPDAGALPDLAPLAPAYVSEARHLDHVMQPLFAWLEAEGRLSRSVLIFSSDHGEGFGEHGVYHHTRLGFEELVRVPIVLIAPGVSPGEREQLVSHRDLPATLLGAFGLEAEARAHERFGRSLLRVRESPTAEINRAVVVHSGRQSSGSRVNGPLGVLVTSRHKLVLGVDDGIRELYDLVADPGERTNLLVREPALADRLTRELSLFMDAERYPAQKTRGEWVTPEAEAKD